MGLLYSCRGAEQLHRVARILRCVAGNCNLHCDAKQFRKVAKAILCWELFNFNALHFILRQKKKQTPSKGTACRF